MVCKSGNILIVEGEGRVRAAYGPALVAAGYRATVSGSEQDALRRAEREPFDVALVEIERTDPGGLAILDELKGRQPWMEMIVVASLPSLETAKAAVRSGASEFISSPIDLAETLRAVAAALERRAWAIRPCDESEAAGARPPNGDACWLMYEGGGLVTVGLQPPFLESIGGAMFVELPAEGEVVERDGRLCAVLATDRRIHRVPSPIGGRVMRVNEKMMFDPDEMRRGPDAGGWLLRLRTAPD